jgi:hypothetical protein
VGVLLSGLAKAQHKQWGGIIITLNVQRAHQPDAPNQVALAKNKQNNGYVCTLVKRLKIAVDKGMTCICSISDNSGTFTSSLNAAREGSFGTASGADVAACYHIKVRQ